MSDIHASPEEIGKIIQDVLNNRDYGLDYAAFLPGDPFDAQMLETGLKAKIECTSLGEKLPGAFVHTPQKQLEWWNMMIPVMHATMQRLHDFRSVVAGPGALGSGASAAEVSAQLRPACLVLDVEIGGLLCAIVGERGWVFAATLDQLVMNDGKAEEGLLKVADNIHKLAEHSSGPPVDSVHREEGEAHGR